MSATGTPRGGETSRTPSRASKRRPSSRAAKRRDEPPPPDPAPVAPAAGAPADDDPDATPGKRSRKVTVRRSRTPGAALDSPLAAAPSPLVVDEAAACSPSPVAGEPEPGPSPLAGSVGASPQKRHRKVTVSRKIKAADVLDVDGDPLNRSGLRLPLASLEVESFDPTATAGPQSMQDTASIKPWMVLGDPDDFEDFQRSLRLSRGEPSTDDAAPLDTPPLPPPAADEPPAAQSPGPAAAAAAPAPASPAVGSVKKQPDGLPPNISIFDKMEYDRQTHSLERFQQATKEWERTKDYLAKKVGKDPEDLIISRTDEWRERKEESELIERSLPLLMERPLRKYAEAPMRFDNDKPIEIIRQPGSRSKSAGKARMWTQSEYLQQRRRQLRQYISHFVEKRPETDELQVLGHGVGDSKPGSAATSGPGMDPDMFPGPAQMPDGDGDDEDEADVGDKDPMDTSELEGEARLPSLDMRASRLMIEALIGTRATGVVRAENTGPVTIYYTWTKAAVPNDLGTRADNVQRFFFSDLVGAILPGATKEFMFSFKSATPGVFSEEWQFSSSPEVDIPNRTLTLKGVALEVDSNEAARQELETYIGQQQVEHMAAGILDEILAAIPPERPATPPKEPVHELADRFQSANEALGLIFVPTLYAQLENLFGRVAERRSLEAQAREAEAEEAAAAAAAAGAEGTDGDGDAAATEETPEPQAPVWDDSIGALEKLIAGVEDDAARSEAFQELDALVRELSEQAGAATLPTDSYVYDTTYAMLGALADDIADASARLRTRLGLPPRLFPVVEDMQRDYEAMLSELGPPPEPVDEALLAAQAKKRKKKRKDRKGLASRESAASRGFDSPGGPLRKAASAGDTTDADVVVLQDAPEGELAEDKYERYLHQQVRDMLLSMVDRFARVMEDSHALTRRASISIPLDIVQYEQALAEAARPDTQATDKPLRSRRTAPESRDGRRTPRRGKRATKKSRANLAEQ